MKLKIHSFNFSSCFPEVFVTVEKHVGGVASLVMALKGSKYVGLLVLLQEVVFGTVISVNLEKTSL
jgi:hypothetical protein